MGRGKDGDDGGKKEGGKKRGREMVRGCPIRLDAIEGRVRHDDDEYDNDTVEEE